MEGVQPPAVSDLFGKKGRAFLETVKIRESRRLALDNYLNVLDVLTERIIMVEPILEEKAELTEEVRWFESIPGIGFHNAVLILSELGAVARFPRPQGLVCYAGLAPKVAQSGDQVRYGHINRQSNGFLRWALIQSAWSWSAVRSSTPNRFQRLYLKEGEGEKRREGGDCGHCASVGRIDLLGAGQTRSLSGNKGRKSLVFFFDPFDDRQNEWRPPLTTRNHVPRKARRDECRLMRTVRGKYE